MLTKCKQTAVIRDHQGSLLFLKSEAGSMDGPSRSYSLLAIVTIAPAPTLRRTISASGLVAYRPMRTA